MFVEALTNRGWVLHLLDRHEDALANYGKALSLRPKFVDALLNKGATLLAMGRIEAAQEDCNQVLAIAPDNERAVIARGALLKLTGRLAEATEHFEQAVARSSESVELHYQLGLPEVGMDPMSARLAAQRLAPVQCVGIGHPETTGYPTIDYFLTSDLMEPHDAQDYYTERLVRLPNLSVYYEPVRAAAVPMQRGDFGLRQQATVYFCGQSLYKYPPQYDQVFARIAQEVGDCQFAFIEYQHCAYATGLFKERLARAFAARELKADDYCVFLPRLDQQRFIAAAGLCDAMLDSFAWSGFNSTLESLAHALPVVTMPGDFACGRHTMAVLRMMGVTETIATTIDDYVAIAVGLARDLPWRTALKRRIAESRERVYRDRALIDALEAFLDEVARQPSR